jgi:hypothetical protein
MDAFVGNRTKWYVENETKWYDEYRMRWYEWVKIIGSLLGAACTFTFGIVLMAAYFTGYRATIDINQFGEAGVEFYIVIASVLTSIASMVVIILDCFKKVK